MTTLVDTSVLLDVLAPSSWRAWSEEHLRTAASRGDLAINQVIYAELGVGFATQDRLERTLQGVGLVRLGIPWAASWLVAQAFLRYRREGGPRSTPLLDFFIGAHASAVGLQLLTRDPKRVRTYFPDVRLIAPD